MPLTPEEEQLLTLLRLLSEWDRERVYTLTELLAATPTARPADYA